MPAALLSAEKVERRFLRERCVALADVSVAFARGEYAAITGPSGSGKSTLLHVLSGLDRPTSGRVLFEGREPRSAADWASIRARHIGFVFQSFHLVPRLTAAQNVELPMILAGIPAEERKQRVEVLMQNYGLAARADHRPDQLSGGQRQRVAIARATVMKPSVLLADEPTGNLDRTTGWEVLKLLEGLLEQGITLVVVTHDGEIGARAHRQIHMLDGNILSDEKRSP